MKKNRLDIKAVLEMRQTRRNFIRKAAYASPVLLTLPAAPSFAQQGSAAGGGVGDGGDPDGMPDLGPRPASEIDCNAPLQPIDSDVAQNMCTFSVDEDSGEFLVQDVIVSNDAVAGRVANGDIFGTCDEFICNAS